jgi:hypothetical protein
MIYQLITYLLFFYSNGIINNENYSPHEIEVTFHTNNSSVVTGYLAKFEAMVVE